MDSLKTREYELTSAQKKIDACRLTDPQKTREYNLKGAQKTDENSSCVKERKNDGVEIIHECQRKRAFLDVNVKPVVRDPLDDDRVLVESGTEMTPVPHEPSEFEKQKQSHSHPILTMVHIMRQRQSTSGTTQANRAHHRRQRTPSDTM